MGFSTTLRFRSIIHLKTQARIPFVNISTNCACFDGCVGRSGSVLEESDIAYLREQQSAISEYCAVSILWIREGVIPVPPFESGMTYLLAFLGPFKEALECPFKPQSNILQDLRVHFPQEWII